LNGGDGDDVAHFKGSRDDYQIETVENGVLLVGPDGTDLLIDVEELMFSDGSVARVEDLLNAGEPEPDPLPEPQPEEGSVYELQRGDLVEGGSGEDIASFMPEENGGIRVMGINASTAIGTELGLEEGDGGYVITDKSASAFFAGEEVYASYWSTQENVAAKDGPTLGATALDTALSLGAVVSGVEKIEGTDKNDMFVGASADDHFAGGDGADRLLGRNGDDLLEGGGGDDHLYGGAGEDTLIGGDGSDVMSGGAGQNTFVFGEGDLGVDYLTDFKIGDVIDLQGFSFGGMSEVEARASASDDGVYIDLGDGAGFVLVDISLSSFDDITILT
ncbi:MAG: hypothetical protein AAFP78_02545, partial [Pseudomonadota bacterium]